jgi:amidase
LVPYTGAFPIELTLDHLGPMARSAADCKLMLEVIAGPDGLDPRQRSGQAAQSYTRALTGTARGLRLGLLDEGFGWKGVSEKDVDEAVTAAAHLFEKIGAHVEEVSIRWHREAFAVWTATGAEGATATMITGNSMGTNWKGYYATGLLDSFARGLRERPDDLSETTKLFALLGIYRCENYHGRYYAKAQNLARSMTAAYNTALRDHDLLMMPTTPMKATRIPASGCSREEYVGSALNMGGNTAPFNISGHPARR